MFLQDQGDGSPEPRLRRWISRYDPRAGACKRMPPDSLGDNFSNLIPSARDLTNNDDQIRRQPGDEDRDASAKVVGHLPQRLFGLRVTLFRQPQ